MYQMFFLNSMRHDIREDEQKIQVMMFQVRLF